MVVKDKIGRRRYIIAEKKENLDEIIKEFKGRIVYENEKFAVIFCKHYLKDFALKTLHENSVKTYKTTGTIKKAKKIISNLHFSVNQFF